ncbi:hypothetical protein [Mycobacterium montefiorense]|nr:hypothetical protein [Mycobacterium montefiorense]
MSDDSTILYNHAGIESGAGSLQGVVSRSQELLSEGNAAQS